jgi:antitoxin component YwqK of YwqJK toxin-antitoxin module
MAAEGWFVDEEKDSVWTYYSEFDGLVRFREPYQKGSLHGTLERYYQHGKVSEAVEWNMDQKQGSWKQYYPDGSIRLLGTYVDDQLHGPYRVFYPDSTLKIDGRYQQNLSEGNWNYYDEAGQQIYTIEYKNGKALDQERYLQLMDDSIMKQEVMMEPDSGTRPNF